MAIDFPNTPTNGDTFTVGSVTWIYVSATTSWNVNSSALFALDADVVHKAGTETVTGRKTFTGTIGLPTVFSTELVGYGDDLELKKNAAHVSGVWLNIYKSRGTAASPAGVSTSDGIGQINWWAYNGVGSYNNVGWITVDTLSSGVTGSATPVKVELWSFGQDSVMYLGADSKITLDVTRTTGTVEIKSGATGGVSIGSNLTTGYLQLATVGTGATPITIGHTNATIGIIGNTTITGTLNPTNAADTATAATHYWVETGSDGLIRPKTLANVKTEIVTGAAITAGGGATDSLVVHLAGTETITGAKTFTANPIVRSTSTIPSIDVQSIQATGYTPAFVNMVRQGAASAATPDSVAIGELRYSGLTTTSAYFMAASINVNSGVNTATGAPSDMTFLTHNGTASFERFRITSAGGFEFKNSTIGGAGAAAVKINDTSGAGAIMILNDAAGTSNRFLFWDGAYEMITEGGSVKQAFRDYDSSSQADSMYTYRSNGTVASPTNLAIGSDIYFTYRLGRVAGSEQYMAYERWRQDGSNPTSANAVQGAATRDGAWQIGLGNNDWGATYENIMMLSQGDITFAGSGMDGYAHKLWNDPRARMTVIGISDHWSDLTITGSISGDQLTVSVAGARNITLGMRLWSSSGTAFPPGVYISALGTGTGGTGTYTLSTNLGTIASQSISLEERPSYAPTFRIRDAETVPTVGKNFGTIEFWSDWTSGDGKGVKGFIASKIKSTGASDLVFGTSSTTQNAVEKLRITSAAIETNNVDINIYRNGTGANMTFYHASGTPLAPTESGVANTGWIGFASRGTSAYSFNAYIDIYTKETTGTNIPATSMEFTVGASGGTTTAMRLFSIPDLKNVNAYPNVGVQFGDLTSNTFNYPQAVNSSPLVELLGTHYNASDTFTASISGTTMTVSVGGFGHLKVGMRIEDLYGNSANGIVPGTFITALGTGTGGTGTYTLSTAQTVASASISAHDPTSMPILRLRNNNSSNTNRELLGQIEVYGQDSTGPGAGTKSFISTYGNAAAAIYMAFGVADTTVNATERMRLDSTGVNIAATADTSTAATHYYVETATDGYIRPKTLANVRTEIVTTAAVNSAAATTVGTITSGVWNAGAITTSGNVAIGAATQQITLSGGAGAHGIEIGRTDNVASTPFIDFHSGTTGANDYDARIIASGGTASNGQGQLTINAGAAVNLEVTLGTVSYFRLTQSVDLTLGSRQMFWGNSGGMNIKALVAEAIFTNTTPITAQGVSGQSNSLIEAKAFGGSQVFAVSAAGAISSSSTVSATGLAGSLLSSANPIGLGTVGPGTSAIPSRQDHVHPRGGGAVGGGTDAVFYENDTTVTTNYTITSGKNAMTAGPITVNAGITVTVPSGSTWTVV